MANAEDHRTYVLACSLGEISFTLMKWHCGVAEEIYDS